MGSHSSCCFRKTHARARVQFHVVLMRNQQQHLHINFHNHERRTATEYPSVCRVVNPHTHAPTAYALILLHLHLHHHHSSNKQQQSMFFSRLSSPYHVNFRPAISPNNQLNSARIARAAAACGGAYKSAYERSFLLSLSLALSAFYERTQQLNVK